MLVRIQNKGASPVPGSVALRTSESCHSHAAAPVRVNPGISLKPLSRKPRVKRDRISCVAQAKAHAHSYQRHRPEQTLFYELVAEHYPAFLERMACEGRALPDYVRREFDELLRCGRLEHGFLRVRCDSCRAGCSQWLKQFQITRAG